MWNYVRQECDHAYAQGIKQPAVWCYSATHKLCNTMWSLLQPTLKWATGETHFALDRTEMRQFDCVVMTVEDIIMGYLAKMEKTCCTSVLCFSYSLSLSLYTLLLIFFLHIYFLAFTCFVNCVVYFLFLSYFIYRCGWFAVFVLWVNNFLAMHSFLHLYMKSRLKHCCFYEWCDFVTSWEDFVSSWIISVCHCLYSWVKVTATVLW